MFWVVLEGSCLGDFGGILGDLGGVLAGFRENSWGVFGGLRGSRKA